MDPKLPSSFWSLPEVESAGPEIKLAALWMKTNAGLTLFGYAQVSVKRFSFETGLETEWFCRAFEALPEHFKKTEKGYWIPGYIGEQIGRAEALLANNMCKPLIRALQGLGDAAVTDLVLSEYPELEVAFKVLRNPLPRGAEAQEERREEKSRAEQRNGDRGAGEETGRKSSRKNGTGLTPAEAGPLGPRMLMLNRLFNRQPETAWSEEELQAAKVGRLGELVEAEFAAQAEAMIAFYRADIPREMEKKFWRRTGLVRVLRHWPEELDRARMWAAQTRRGAGSDGLQRLSDSPREEGAV